MQTMTRLTKTAQRAAEALELRDQLIEQARAEGHTVRAVAEAAGVSHQTVLNIIARRDRAAA
jgi:transposase